MPSTRSFTFFFTDVEGSTRLLSRLGADDYADLLGAHHRIVRDALARHGGVERDTQGDAFFVTFDSPSACLGAAIDIQRSLAGYDWPRGEALRVRMGVHSGEATETPTGLIGVDVHRASRIAGVAHGGQVVLSESAATIVRDHLPPGTALRHLGQHRLKDLGRPEVLFQVVADALETDFPPLRSLDNPELPNNLPVRSSTFVGRGGELSDVRTLAESSRVVTLAGAGGVGKTRLALEVAAQLLEANREGVFFVDLSGVADPDEVPAAIRTALGLEPLAPAEGNSLEALLDVLATQQTLLVLDNCEHVIDACAKFAELVEERSRAVHILATSREPLGIDGERVYRLGPLSLPPADVSTLADLADSDAVELFVERARATDAGFLPDDAASPILASICRRLDGVPFALELAAARTGSMSLADLHRRLDQRFALLTSGRRTALPRQRTLMATVDWSYDLLVPEERAVLDQLSVFAGSFDLAAAESVCAPVVADAFGTMDVLTSLVDKSLVAAERVAGDVRYRLLETIRQYAADKLAARGGQDLVDEVRRLHAVHYLALAERAEPALRGGREQGAWMKRLDLDWTDVRAAADHLDATGDTESLMRLCVALYRWCSSRANDELFGMLHHALERGSAVAPELRAKALLAASWMRGTGQPSDADLVDVVGLADAGIALARELGAVRTLTELLVIRAFCAFRFSEAGFAPLAQEALACALESGDPGLVGLARMAVARVEEGSGATRLDERLETLRYFEQAEDFLGASGQLSDLSGEYLVAGDVLRALDYARRAALVNAELGGRVDLEGNLSVCALLAGELEEAVRSARVSLLAGRRNGLRTGAMNSFAVWVLACCAARAGDVERAALLTGAHEALDAHFADTAPNSFRWTPPEQAAREDNLRRLTSALGEDGFRTLREQGRAMPVDAVFDLALGRTA